jgi:hypothetical protein
MSWLDDLGRLLAELIEGEHGIAKQILIAVAAIVLCLALGAGILAAVAQSFAG